MIAQTKIMSYHKEFNKHLNRTKLCKEFKNSSTNANNQHNNVSSKYKDFKWLFKKVKISQYNSIPLQKIIKN